METILITKKAGFLALLLWFQRRARTRACGSGTGGVSPPTIGGRCKSAPTTARRGRPFRRNIPPTAAGSGHGRAWTSAPTPNRPCGWGSTLSHTLAASRLAGISTRCKLSPCRCRHGRTRTTLKMRLRRTAGSPATACGKSAYRPAGRQQLTAVGRTKAHPCWRRCFPATIPTTVPAAPSVCRLPCRQRIRTLACGSGTGGASTPISVPPTSGKYRSARTTA